MVGVRPEDELVAAIGDARTRVLAHRAWHSGSHRVDTLLEMATRIRQMEIDNLGGTLPPWETVLGLLISWHHQVPVAHGVMAHEDAVEIVLAAAHTVTGPHSSTCSTNSPPPARGSTSSA